MAPSSMSSEETVIGLQAMGGDVEIPMVADHLIRQRTYRARDLDAPYLI